MKQYVLLLSVAVLGLRRGWPLNLDDGSPIQARTQLPYMIVSTVQETSASSGHAGADGKDITKSIQASIDAVP
jgi:hypothetical protein